VTPLYGHTSEETAYLVADYPYGRTVRCRIRYWLEHREGTGYRFVSQTENPKTLRWNAPKKTTYTPIAACMFLDENEHVQWASFCDWKPEDALSFIQRFPQAPGIDKAHDFLHAKIDVLHAFIVGKRYTTINGERQEYTDADRERHQTELEQWRAVLTAFPQKQL
jgi:hypothetical protein